MNIRKPQKQDIAATQFKLETLMMEADEFINHDKLEKFLEIAIDRNTHRLDNDMNELARLLVHALRFTTGNEKQTQLILSLMQKYCPDTLSMYNKINELRDQQHYMTVRDLCLADISSNSPLQEYTTLLLYDLLIANKIELDEPESLFEDLTIEQKHAIQSYNLIEKFTDKDEYALKQMCGLMLTGGDCNDDYTSPTSWGKDLASKYYFYSLYKRNPSDPYMKCALDLESIAFSTPLAAHSLFNKPVNQRETGNIVDSSINYVI